MSTIPATLNPANCVMVLIDHQVGTMQLIKTLPLDHVRRMTLALARAAVILDMPVFLSSSQEENFQGPLLPEFADLVPHAYHTRVRRAGVVNAWDDPAFRNAIKATGRTQLIMAGVTTDVCLIYPAISAVAEGFQVHAVLDASGSPFELSEDLARRRMAQAGVVLTATNTLIAELAGDWSSATGQPLIALLMAEVLGPVLA